MVFETGSHYAALCHYVDKAGLRLEDLPLPPPCLLSAGIKGMDHQSWLLTSLSYLEFASSGAVDVADEPYVAIGKACFVFP